MSTNECSWRPAPRRRANGQGTVYRRRDGRWEAAGHVRVRVYGASREQAQARLDAALGQRETRDDGVTVAAFLTDWLETVAAPRLRVTTLRHYRHCVRAFLIPGLGDRPVHALTARDVRAWLDEVREQCQCCAQGLDARRDPNHPRQQFRPRCCAVGRCCGRRIAPGTVAYLRTVLSSALAHAMGEDDLSRNVARAVRLGPVRHRLFEPLTATEAVRLLAATADSRWRVLFELALRTGLRRGELLGLQWSDLDDGAGTLRVTRTLQRTPQGLTLLPTKTTGSQRRIPLPGVVLTALAGHRARQHADGHDTGPGGLVFTTPVGRPVDGGVLNKELTALCARAQVHRIRFHDLRHTCATLLLEQGVELVTIKELLGHTKIQTTADVYAHVRLRLRRQAVDAMDNALRQPPTDPDSPHDPDAADGFDGLGEPSADLDDLRGQADVG